MSDILLAPRMPGGEPRTFIDQSDRKGFEAVAEAPEVALLRKVKQQLIAHTVEVASAWLWKRSRSRASRSTTVLSGTHIGGSGLPRGNTCQT